MKEVKEISQIVQSGMNRDVHPSLAQPNETSFALNSNTETNFGDKPFRTNEPSNILNVQFPENYKNIGYKTDLLSSRTYVFLTNTVTGYSSFGYIPSTQNVIQQSDTETQCEDCEYYNNLGAPLETVTQVASNTYVELLNDLCNKAFNFDINFPIKSIEIKNEKVGSVIYFTDNKNPQRYIQLDYLEIYNQETLPCTDTVTPICLDVEKMRMSPIYEIPEIKPDTIQNGGNLKKGTYTFLIAYSDKAGNEISEYYSVTIPISIFDQNNNTLEQSELNSTTNYAIKLDIINLDKNYKYYKIVVVQNTDLLQAESYFVEGVHPTTDTTVIYTSEVGKTRTSLENIQSVKVRYKTAEGLTSSNGYLFQYGLKEKSKINLQPVVNLFSQFTQWNSTIAKEGLYKDGIASSLYTGYNRDEIYALGIRTLHKDGEVSKIFPFIGREANEQDLTLVNVNSQDKLSIDASLSNCNITERTKRWQFYNDATIDSESCLSDDIPTNIVEEDITKVCRIENVVTTPSGAFSIDLNEEFVDLKTFIEDNLDTCTSGCGSLAPSDYPFCEYTNLSCYTDQNCLPEFLDNCGEPLLLLPEELVIAEEGIVNETLTFIPKIFPDEYSLLKRPQGCNIYLNDSSTGNPQKDLESMYLYRVFNETSGALRTFGDIYFRDFNFVNTGCNFPDDIINLTDITTPLQSYFHNYLGATTKVELQTTKTATSVNNVQGEFTDKIHKGALWFKGDTLGRDEFIFEITKYLDPAPDDTVSVGSTIRMNVYNSCNSVTPLYSNLINLFDGIQLKFRVSGGNLFVKDQTLAPEQNLGAFIGTKFLVALDAPIIQTRGVVDVTNPPFSTVVDKFLVSPTDGCFGVALRDIENVRIDVTYDSITFDKVQTYISTCEFEIPIVQDCKAIPYKKGEFGYWESSENYPDNKQLYDSSNLLIKPLDIPTLTRDKFERKFVEGTVVGLDFVPTLDLDGNYILKENTDFRCKPIRHFKMPDNKVSPFMWDNVLAPTAPTVIFPLAVSIDENLINSFLDIARNNNLISQEERDSIVGYEIVRGNRQSNKSVEASGYLYDMRNYLEGSTKTLYSNFPYNDLGADKLNLLPNSNAPIPHDSNSNYNFTFHSPETDFFTKTIPSELKVEGYVFGKSVGNFVDVLDHPKWTILGRRARRTATQLAILESAAELAIQLATAGENYRVQVTAAGGSVNPVGIGLSIAAAALGAIGRVVDVGRRRYEWLQIFRNLGTPRNFAYYYTSKGYYNYIQNTQSEGNLVRGINLGKYLKSGNFTTTNELTGERFTINNTTREASTFLSLGADYPLVWNNDYKNYDNNTSDNNTSSLTYASELANCTDGKSEEIRRNIASPYVKLKNYIVNQYGTIGSISWLSTGYRGDLLNPSNECTAVFGGDTYITSYELKRKIPLFTEDAMGVASLTPFDYKKYNNIGKNPKFFADYEVSQNDGSLEDGLFPNIDSDFKFDCQGSDRGMYLGSPSKFYLYYYGIPKIICETEINTECRYGGKELRDSFSPAVGDTIDWTQEKNVSIKEQNKFQYNTVYSRPVIKTQFDVNIFDDTYDKEIEDKKNDQKNTVIYSLRDSSENDTYDPWLIYRPLDKYEFPKKYGKLIQLKDLESATILGRFENQQVVFNAIDVLSGRENQITIETGNAGIFQKRPLEFKSTDLGYAGSQHTDMVSTPFGHFSVDAKRGKIFQLDQTGRDLQPISDFINGKPSGIKTWFREHLPFKILKYIPQLDIDNKFKSIGISIGWDAKTERVFFTKKDYVLKQGINKNNFVFTEDRKLLYNNVEVFFNNDTIFEDVSFTIAYKVTEGGWVSYYSFTPDYYIGHNDYFQTGLNYGEDKETIWGHGLLRNSFQVFYGRLYPFIVELPIKNENTNKVLSSIMIDTEAKRLTSDWDFTQHKEITFNKVNIYNNTNNSGLINLSLQKSLRDLSKYPKTSPDKKEQEILFTTVEDKIIFNYFYNRVINQDNNVPQFLWDKNMLNKEINLKAVNFSNNSKTLNRLRGESFSVRFIQDKESRFQLIFKDMITTSNAY